MSRFSGRVVIVTGASAGIGRATALAFAREEAKVILGDIDLERGREVESIITDGGGQAVFVRCDVSRDNDCKSLVDTALSRFGRLDAAVNNAGIEQTGVPIVEATTAEFDRIMRPNVLGVLMCMKHEIPAIINSGKGDRIGGAIINLSSIAGLLGFPTASVYVASKHAVIGLTRTAALEHAGDRIRINAVCPGAIETEMIDRFTHHDLEQRQALAAAHPLGRFGRAQEIADTILWLSSSESSFITGQYIPVDGGYTAQ